MRRGNEKSCWCVKTVPYTETGLVFLTLFRGEFDPCLLLILSSGKKGSGPVVICLRSFRMVFIKAEFPSIWLLTRKSYSHDTVNRRPMHVAENYSLPAHGHKGDGNLVLFSKLLNYY